MKVMHIIDSLVSGGKERRLLEFLKAARRFPGLENCLIILSDTVHYADAATLGIPVIHIRRRSAKDMSVFAKLYRLCGQHQPDIIHSWESMCSIYAVPVAKLLGIKLINAMITNATRITPGHPKWIRSRLTFPFSDMIFANSRAGLNAYKAPRRKSVCIHNGFNFDRIREIEPAARTKRAHGIHAPRAIGMVASMDARKDWSGFIGAARHFLPGRKDLCFVAVGGGPMLAHYRNLASAGDAADRISFLGRQTGVDSLIESFEIGLLLTRTCHGEGISNAIMEYMAFAKPVIASTGGGTSEIVVDGETGFLVPAGNRDLLFRRIRELLDNRPLAEKMGRAGQRRIREKFSIEKMTHEIIAHYQACLNGDLAEKRAPTVPRVLW
jgi:glycosyltransferase involved in cell wall biosynthesis